MGPSSIVYSCLSSDRLVTINILGVVELYWLQLKRLLISESKEKEIILSEIDKSTNRISSTSDKDNYEYDLIFERDQSSFDFVPRIPLSMNMKSHLIPYSAKFTSNSRYIVSGDDIGDLHFRQIDLENGRV